jgi:hypothetical protein
MIDHQSISKPIFTPICIYLLFGDFVNLHIFLFTSSHRFSELHCFSATFGDPRVPREYLLAVISGCIAVVRTKVLVSSSLSINRSNRLARFGYRFRVLALCVCRSTFASIDCLSTHANTSQLKATQAYRPMSNYHFCLEQCHFIEIKQVTYYFCLAPDMHLAS